MPAFLRSLLIFLGVSLFTSVAVGGWYWSQLRQPAPELSRLLKRAMPAVEQLLDDNKTTQAMALLDKLPFQVVVAEPDGQAVTSNLAGSGNERKALGQRAVSQGLLTRSLPGERFSFYYRPPADWQDPQLLFPLFFGLLLGLVATLWDFLQRMHEVDQTDALLMLSHLPGVAHHQEHEQHVADASGLEAQVAELEQKNRSLHAALQKARQWTTAAPDAETGALEKQLRKLETQLIERDQRLHQATQVEARLRTQQIEAEATAAAIRLQHEASEAEARTLRAQHQKQDTEITRLHQDNQRQLRDIESTRSRLEELEAQAAQLHEVWQEISAMRKTQGDLMAREEAWKKEKQRVMNLMHEKDEALADARERLKDSRQKVHELSLAYKKQLELSQNMPGDLKDASQVLGSLIEDKDQIEHENVQLQIELADRSSEVARLRKELEVRALRLQEAKQLIDDLSDELRKHERELSLMGETLSDKLLDLDRLKDLHDEKTQVLESTVIERDRLRLRLSELETEVETLREDKGHLLFERDQLEEQLRQIDVEAYQLEIEQLRQSMQLMGQQQQRRVQALEQLKTKLKEGEDLYARLKRHSEVQERDIRSLQQERAKYQSEIQLLHDKLEPTGDFEPLPSTGWTE